MLVAYEGISGSGKSESMKRLLARLESAGLEAVLVEWNANRAIRMLAAGLNSAGLLGPRVYSLLQWLGFLLDYALIIAPALRKDRIVIADRYVHTALTRDATNGAGIRLGSRLARLVRPPDRVVFLDTPPELCYERIRVRGKRLFHPNKRLQGDDLTYLRRMREAYICLFGGLKPEGGMLAEIGVEVVKTEAAYSSDSPAEVRVERFVKERLGAESALFGPMAVKANKESGRANGRTI
ncbi:MULTISPECIES: AAA family ATPase [unclassified Paenibacillus]|uniref:dTMP kinase n=1 Tax=unclassified Paenibacillus TaxID=185978 RepID=UPI0015A301D6|nr:MULTISPECIES: AAA family ATPase [unclassified Paenibacillus]